MATPSQVSKVKGCARKLALGLFTPYAQSESAQLGDEVHAIAQAYQTDGQAPGDTVAGRTFMPGLVWTPNPRTCTPETQVKWRFGGVTWVLRPDLHGLTAHLPKAPAGAPRVFVLDYKSSKDPKAYGLWDKQSFLGDEEAVIYALWAMVKYEVPDVLLRWLYLRTPEKGGKHKPKATPSDVVVTWEEACAAYDRNVLPYVPIVDGVYREKWAGRLTTESALALLPNPNHCGAFGGCAFRTTCNLSPIATLKEDTYTMDLLAEAQRLTPAMNAPAAPPPGFTPPSAPAAPTVNAVPVSPFIPPSAPAAPPPPQVTVATPDMQPAAHRATGGRMEPYGHQPPVKIDEGYVSNEELGAALRVMFRALFGGRG